MTDNCCNRKRQKRRKTENVFAATSSTSDIRWLLKKLGFQILIGSIEERLALTACCVCQCHKFWVQILSVTLWSADYWRPFRYFNGNARIDCCCVMLWSLRLRPPRRHTSTLVREWCFFWGPRRCLKHANSIDLQTKSEWFMSTRRKSSRRLTRCVSIMRNRHYCDTVILCSQNLFLTVTRYEF